MLLSFPEQLLSASITFVTMTEKQVGNQFFDHPTWEKRLGTSILQHCNILWWVQICMSLKWGTHRVVAWFKIKKIFLLANVLLRFYFLISPCLRKYISSLVKRASFQSYCHFWAIFRAARTDIPVLAIYLGYLWAFYFPFLFSCTKSIDKIWNEYSASIQHIDCIL